MPNSSCVITDCPGTIKARGLCDPHYRVHRTAGTLEDVALPPKTTQDNVAPVGTKRVSPEGYVMVKVDSVKWIGEHRLVAQQIFERDLVKGETVHHVTGIKTDNRPVNLELWFSPQPSGQRVGDLINYVVAHHRRDVERALGLPPTVAVLVRHSFDCALPTRGGLCTCGPDL